VTNCRNPSPTFHYVLIDVASARELARASSRSMYVSSRPIYIVSRGRPGLSSLETPSPSKTGADEAALCVKSKASRIIDVQHIGRVGCRHDGGSACTLFHDHCPKPHHRFFTRARRSCHSSIAKSICQEAQLDSAQCHSESNQPLSVHCYNHVEVSCQGGDGSTALRQCMC